MLGVFEAILLGIVQGITEWLPISSSGHLAIIQKVLGLGTSLYFDALLHVATVVVVSFHYRRDLYAILKAFTGLDLVSSDGRLGALVLVGTFPTAAIGLLFRSFFESSFSNLTIVGAGFLFSAILLGVSKGGKGTSDLSVGRALLVGVMQGIAVTPGVSRSGSTISTGLMLGVERKEAARYSLLLLIPASLGALVLEAGNITVVSVVPSIIGMIVAAIVGYASLRLLLRVVEKGHLHSFMYYCIGVGILTLLLSTVV